VRADDLDAPREALDLELDGIVIELDDLACGG